MTKKIMQMKDLLQKLVQMEFFIFVENLKSFIIVITFGIMTKIFSILDEIIEINEAIILKNDQGLTPQTLEGLRIYKNDLLVSLDKITMNNNRN